MSDTNPNENMRPDENREPEENIGEQLNELGKNLREALKAAWESEERQKLQQEIATGLANLRDSLNEAATDFSQSQAGQNIKGDVDDLRQRWHTGDLGSKVRSEIAEALRTVNRELEKAARRTQPPPPPPPPDVPQG